MAIKKSLIYSSLWSACDELRGGMDASQYKDYVLVLLFIKYISDKYAGVPYAPIEIPPGSSFADLVALKGKPDIGDQINKKIIAPLAEANRLTDTPDFNDANKLGSNKEMVDRLSNLIAIFEDKRLDFSKNRADGDDILGDAYEYLMRHFATESGKSKGQFYTPAEVSRVMAQVIGIGQESPTRDTTVYDPTCGSGSLLLKVASEAHNKVTLYGQEKEATTAGLARMNMILHDNPTAVIAQGNTLTIPQFKEGESLKTFDYAVSNPPFSDKRWSNGLQPDTDPFDRFQPYGIPPAKQGDYAYLLHLIRSLKSTGKGAIILPHGVLFRGNSEAEIRKNLLKKGYIKGIIGLPANLFYGTGIPACIVMVDKSDAFLRKGIFIINASKGFLKEGPKNRLRALDIHKIVDTFTRQIEIPGYSRMVPISEIEANDFNLNIPRYIDSRDSEDLQDIEGHLKGGIPERDIEALAEYWTLCPSLRQTLFRPLRPGYQEIVLPKDSLRPQILAHPEFQKFTQGLTQVFEGWKGATIPKLKALVPGFHPKQLIADLGEALLDHFKGQPLIDPYDVYQHLIDYWEETMQDDAYMIAADGWVALPTRIVEKDKKGKEKDKGWMCELVPKTLVVGRYFSKDQEAIDALQSELESLESQKTTLEEENGGEEGLFSELEKINKSTVSARLREIKGDSDSKEEIESLQEWLDLESKETTAKKQLKEVEAALDAKALAQYDKLSESDVKSLLVEDKWMASLSRSLQEEIGRISQRLTGRIKELVERYEIPLPQIDQKTKELEKAVTQHLERMGFSWD